MKKIFAVFLALILTACLFSGAALAGEKRISVVTTIFPIYDWVREIADDSVEITLLMDSGVDLHSYQPTAQDILKISTADLFIFVGGESDEWVEDVLQTAMNPDLVAVNLVEAMGEKIKMEELVEGMEHEHGDDHEEDHEEEEEEEADEHVWLSLRNAAHLVGVISSVMAEIDPGRADSYRISAKAYIEKLAALDSEYVSAVESAAYKTILFGDRFPFRYLADDYGLSYYAAFSGCSAESEASFQTIVFLAQKVDELHLPAVLTIENPKTRIAETIVNATAGRDQKILSMDSMQGVTARDIEAGKTYLDIMESNLKILVDALN